MAKKVFKHTITFKITKKELREYGSFCFPELIMDSIIEESLYIVSEGIAALGEGGLGLITGMLIELKRRNAIILNDKGKGII